MTRLGSSRDPLQRVRLQLEEAADRLLAEESGARPAPRRISARRVGLASAVAVAAGAIAITTAVDSGRVDVIKATAAAIAPDTTGVLHIVVVGGPTDGQGRPVRSGLSTDSDQIDGFFDRRYEQWSTADPLQFRSRQGLTRPDGRPLGTYDAGITADGRSWSDLSWDDAPPEVQPLRRAAPLGDGAKVGAFGTPDPLAGLRVGIRNGSVKEASSTEIDGEALTRLTQTDSSKRRTDFLVDPETGTPRYIRRYEGDTLSESLKIVTFNRHATNISQTIFHIPRR